MGTIIIKDKNKGDLTAFDFAQRITRSYPNTKFEAFPQDKKGLRTNKITVPNIKTSTLRNLRASTRTTRRKQLKKSF